MGNVITDAERSQGYLTERQWNTRGYKLKADAQGILRWNNQFCNKQYMYYNPNEVETNDAIAEELRLERKETRRLQRIAEYKKQYDEIADTFRPLLESRDEEIKQLTNIIKGYEKSIGTLLSEIAKNSKVDTTVRTAKAICLDTETTGFDVASEEILQISIIDSDCNVLLDTYIKPYFKTEWEDASQINGITPKMVKDAPYMHQVLPQLIKIFEDTDLIIGYNVSFDLKFLSKYVYIPQDKEIYDVMKEFAPIYGDYNAKYDCFKYKKLTVCADYYGYDWENDIAHNSLSDAKATLYCYKSMNDIPL